MGSARVLVQTCARASGGGLTRSARRRPSLTRERSVCQPLTTVFFPCNQSNSAATGMSLPVIWVMSSGRESDWVSCSPCCKLAPDCVHCRRAIVEPSGLKTSSALSACPEVKLALKDCCCASLYLQGHAPGPMVAAGGIRWQLTCRLGAAAEQGRTCQAQGRKRLHQERQAHHGFTLRR